MGKYCLVPYSRRLLEGNGRYIHFDPSGQKCTNPFLTGDYASGIGTEGESILEPCGSWLYQPSSRTRSPEQQHLKDFRENPSKMRPTPDLYIRIRVPNSSKKKLSLNGTLVPVPEDKQGQTFYSPLSFRCLPTSKVSKQMSRASEWR